MTNYSVDDSGSHILVTHDSVVIETIAKEAVVMQIVLAGESLNKSGIDELWIQHDGKYTSEIPYTSATVASASPSSVEDFRQKVLALLNTNGIYSGGASLSDIFVTIAEIQALDPTDYSPGQRFNVTKGAGSFSEINGGLDTVKSVLVTVRYDDNVGANVFDYNASMIIYITATPAQTTGWRHLPCVYVVSTNTLIEGMHVTAITNRNGTASPHGNINIDLANNGGLNITKNGEVHISVNGSDTRIGYATSGKRLLLAESIFAYKDESEANAAFYIDMSGNEYFQQALIASGATEYGKFIQLAGGNELVLGHEGEGRPVIKLKLTDKTMEINPRTDDGGVLYVDGSATYTGTFDPNSFSSIEVKNGFIIAVS